MRTTLNIDDAALAGAMNTAPGLTKTAVINEELREFPAAAAFAGFSTWPGPLEGDLEISGSRRGGPVRDLVDTSAWVDFLKGCSVTRGAPSTVLRGDDECARAARGRGVPGAPPDAGGGRYGGVSRARTSSSRRASALFPGGGALPRPAREGHDGALDDRYHRGPRRGGGCALLARGPRDGRDSRQRPAEDEALAVPYNATMIRKDPAPPHRRSPRPSSSSGRRVRADRDAPRHPRAEVEVKARPTNGDSRSPTREGPAVGRCRHSRSETPPASRIRRRPTRNTGYRGRLGRRPAAVEPPARTLARHAPLDARGRHPPEDTLAKRPTSTDSEAARAGGVEGEGVREVELPARIRGHRRGGTVGSARAGRGAAETRLRRLASMARPAQQLTRGRTRRRR